MTINGPNIPEEHDRLRAEMISDLKQSLEHLRSEHRRILDELPPAHVDPVAFQQAAATRAVMAQIDAALLRLMDGTYGICTSCGSKIPPGRLEVRPYTAACVPCQEAASR